MTFTNACTAINKAYTTLRNIEHIDDLNRQRLTLAEYEAAKATFAELTTPGATTDTFIKAVADFFKRCGFTVRDTATGYIIGTN